MSNPANIGTVIGRLAQDIKVMPNSDGSRKLLLTIASEDNFRSGVDREIQTNFIQLEHFVPAGRTMGGWDMVHKGDQIAVNFHVEAKPYVNGKGETQYPQKLVVDGFPTFLEPKSVTEKRAADRAIEAAKAAPAEETAEEKIRRLESELAASRAQGGYDTSAPFGG